MEPTLGDVSDTFSTVLSSLVGAGLVGTPQAQAAAQAQQYGVSQTGLNLGSIQIPYSTLVLVAVAFLGFAYLTRGGR